MNIYVCIFIYIQREQGYIKAEQGSQQPPPRTTPAPLLSPQAAPADGFYVNPYTYAYLYLYLYVHIYSTEYVYGHRSSFLHEQRQRLSCLLKPRLR